MLVMYRVGKDKDCIIEDVYINLYQRYFLYLFVQIVSPRSYHFYCILFYPTCKAIFLERPVYRLHHQAYIQLRLWIYGNWMADKTQFCQNSHASFEKTVIQFFPNHGPLLSIRDALLHSFISTNFTFHFLSKYCHYILIASIFGAISLLTVHTSKAKLWQNKRLAQRTRKLLWEIESQNTVWVSVVYKAAAHETIYGQAGSNLSERWNIFSNVSFENSMIRNDSLPSNSSSFS